MRQTMSFFAGAICGALVGATAALLLAPMSGGQLQTQARDRFDNLVDEARQAAEAKRAQLEAQLAALKAPRKAELPPSD